MKPGASFEDYVHHVYETILNLRGERIQVSKRTIFKVGMRESYEIDIYYDFFQVGVRHRVAIECKDWKTPVDQGQVLLFHQKIKNIGDNMIGVFISNVGYQSGAYAVAERHGILLLTAQDLPSLGQLVARIISVKLLPEENCIGEPFWYIGEISKSNGEPTGNYYALPDISPVKMPLFISKLHAQAYLSIVSDKEDYAVFGMPQYKLQGLLAFALLRNRVFGLVFDYPEPDGSVRLSPIDAKSLNKDFLLQPIVER